MPATVAAPQFHRHTDFWAQMMGLQRRLLATSARIEKCSFVLLNSNSVLQPLTLRFGMWLLGVRGEHVRWLT